MDNKIERRTFGMQGWEVREEAEKPKKWRGHAAVFEKETDLHWFREKIARGAFKDAIAEDDVRALFNHNPDYVLGRNKSGTLGLSEDDVGLFVEIEPPDTSFARDLGISIGRGDVSQMSFAFMPVEEKWDFSNRDSPLRTLTKVRLFDVSPVTYPAYEETDIGEAKAIRELAEKRAAGIVALPAHRIVRFRHKRMAIA